ncbi:hypothetical protein ABZS95_33880 [Streptomyces sp. NPDC005479]|uniref:hypothetical protein n=1 Tax=unclassified Streptomyces TaxID=2593676 RepID=UPI0033AF3EC9
MTLTATIAAATPAVPLVPVESAHGGVFLSIPDYARRPHRILPDTTTLTPVGGNEAVTEAAQELFTDLMSQFGLDPQL